MSTAASDGTVLALMPRMILGWLGQHGYDAEALARECDLADMGWQDPDERVPRAKVDALWNVAVRVTNDGAFGLRIHDALPPHHAGVLEVVAHSAATVEVGLRHVCRYWGLLNDGVEMRTEARGGRWVLSVRPKNGVPQARPWLDLTAVGMLITGMRSIATPERPLEVVLPYARDAFSPEVEARLGTKVAYGGEVLELRYRPEVAAMPLTTANPALNAVVAAHAEAALSRLLRERSPAEDDAGALIAEVRAAVLARLEAGDTSLPDVADAVGLSARTLQRRLSVAGTSLREVVDEARHDQALEELKRRDVSITEVAFVLGFSETSAFDRAFRRWEGQSPAEWRAAHSVN
ncbi:MAG: AraC family transcriptional regulator ligand-binding domain-containing protein [Myxococcaceae bacterium]|nr:AraC family transcriptional regulator ligand-binding domain-containing protein [Myxococcaceae bacterium]